MANVFDQFDALAKAPGANVFDQFDSPIQRDAFARMISGEKKPEVSQTEDVAKTIPSSLARGFANTVGLPNTIGHGMRWLTDKGLQQLGYDANPDFVAGTGRYAINNPLDVSPKDVVNRIESVTGPLHEPETRLGERVNSVGEIAGGGLIPIGGASNSAIAAGMKLAPYLRNWLTSSAGAGLASDEAKAYGAGPLGQIAAGIVGGAITPNTVNSAFARGPIDPRLVAKTEAAQAAQGENITIPRAAVAGSMIKKTAGAVADMPVVGAPLKNAAREATDQVGNRTAEIANDYAQTGASANRNLSGGNIRDAIVDYIENGSSATMNRAYQPFDQLLANNTNTYQLPATTAKAQQLVDKQKFSAAGTKVNQGAIDNIADDLTNPNGLTVGQIRNLRTTVGTLLDDKLRPEAGTQEPALRALYGSLTQDLHAATAQAGGPQALQALRRADALNAQMVARRDALNKIVGKQGDKSGENVFDNIIEMARDKGKGANLDTLALARRSVPPQTWDDMSSAFIRRMGIDPKTGDYSADRALTAYNTLSPEGKTLLFNSTGRGDLKRSLDNLASVNQQFSELTKMGNPSGTGGITFLTSLLGVGGIFAPVQAAQGIAAGAGIWGWSKYMASPANVDRMTRTLQARMAYQRNPNPTTEQRFTQAASALSASLKDYQQQNAQ